MFLDLYLNFMIIITIWYNDLESTALTLPDCPGTAGTVRQNFVMVDERFGSAREPMHYNTFLIIAVLVV